MTVTSSIQVLATLIHLSFSKLLITTIDILVFVPVKTEMNGTVTVWYGDGNVFYLEHIILYLLRSYLIGVFHYHLYTICHIWH